MFVAGVLIWLAARGRIDRGVDAGSAERAEAVLAEAG